MAPASPYTPTNVYDKRPQYLSKGALLQVRDGVQAINQRSHLLSHSLPRTSTSTMKTRFCAQISPT
jgi:hypothetical protein